MESIGNRERNRERGRELKRKGKETR